MKLLILLLSALAVNGQILFPILAGGSTTPTHNGFAHYRNITINHALVPNSDQTNFPVLVSGALSPTVANGGSIQHTVTQTGGYGLTIPADAIITTDIGCTSQIPGGWEFESYSATTGAAIFWFMAGTVSHTADTKFYLCYGKASISTQQMTVSATYDSNFGAVWHWPNGTTIQNADSTSNGNTTAATVAVTGEIDGGTSATAAFALAACCTGTNLTPASTLTYEGWANFSSLSNSLNTMGVWDNNRVIGTGGGYTLSVNSSGHIVATIVISGTQISTLGTLTLVTGVWYHLAMTYSNATGLISYVNGVQDGMVAGAGTTIDYSGNAAAPGMRFGTSLTAGSMSGSIDENRVSISVRSADWLRTEYNNQSNLTTFAILSAEN